jgi:hypothetical protein
VHAQKRILGHVEDRESIAGKQAAMRIAAVVDDAHACEGRERERGQDECE